MKTTKQNKPEVTKAHIDNTQEVEQSVRDLVVTIRAAVIAAFPSPVLDANGSLKLSNMIHNQARVGAESIAADYSYDNTDERSGAVVQLTFHIIAEVLDSLSRFHLTNTPGAELGGGLEGILAAMAREGGLDRDADRPGSDE